MGKDVMFEIKLKKRPRSLIICNLRISTSGTQSFLSGPYSVTIHTSVVRGLKGKCSRKLNSNIIHAYMFCATKDPMGHTVKGRRSRDSHK